MNKKYFIGLFFLCLTSVVTGQSLDAARRLFSEGKFEQARPVFRKLVKQAPSNATYNYYYGACCYETGDREEALPYLEKSAARKVIDAYLYLGRLYFDLYRFDESVSNYEEHIGWLEKKKRPTETAEAEMERAKLAARMMKGVERVTVIDSFVVDKESLLDAYRIGKEAGRIYREEGKAGFAYQTERDNKLIYGDRTDDGTMRLYTCDRLTNGWSAPEPLEELNTDGNADFPFLLSDGITLYYASDGDGSLGGYDIFATRYDSDNGTYLRPDNIGMPFNSTANDYLYAIDDFNELGWFASDRYQPEGKICVYVFVPNASKEVFDYEGTDEDVLKDAASLAAIRTTWTDEEQVRKGRQRLAALRYANEESQKKMDFTFIVDDSAVYHTWDDFQSAEARKLYRQLTDKRNDYDRLREDLDNRRERYAAANATQKKQLAPAILDLEKQTEQLLEEMKRLETEVRNTEIHKLKH